MITINLYQAQGKISANTVCFYPPGIPLVNPGRNNNERSY